MSTFHNPYHFVPVERNGRVADRSAKSFPEDRGHVTHDRYVPGTWSGRVVCSLTTETAVFVGGTRTRESSAEAPAEVRHFELDGRPAIPASTLRGLISSIAEAASNSALRVLADSEYSYRDRFSRRRVETPDGKAATTHSFFEAIDPELLPFSSKREIITIAEQVFGFVPGSKDEDGCSLAGRVYFSHALMVSNDASLNALPTPSAAVDYYLPAVTLKILDSPKPPSPALYFKRNNEGSGYIAKQELRPGVHLPQGRKFYLHHRDRELSQRGQEPWQSKYTSPSDERSRLQQKVQITPLRPDTKFFFNVDFHNLSPIELGMLLYALRPTGVFRHKLGMGKAIGLGAVRIDPVGVFRVNRQERYGVSGLSGPRYADAYVALNEDRSSWPESLVVEKTAPALLLEVFDLCQPFTEGMDSNIKTALELLGNPHVHLAPVHTPLIEGGDPENETFRWFVENDKKGKKRDRYDLPGFLSPLPDLSGELPVLPTHRRSKK